MPIDKERLKESLKNINVITFDTIDSTNEECKRMRESKTFSPITPLLIVSNEQTKGKGRQNRSFYSPKNTGLYMSLMLNVKENISDTVRITSAAAVCVCDALLSLTDKEPKIKWVNDVIVDNRKVCGILCELCCDENNIPKHVIIGIGINLNSTFDEELVNIAGNIGEVDITSLCEKIAYNLMYEYENIEKKGFIKKYKEYSCVLGKEVSYIKNDEKHFATAIDIDENGALILDNNEKLSTGEITLRLM